MHLTGTSHFPLHNCHASRCSSSGPSPAPEILVFSAGVIAGCEAKLKASSFHSMESFRSHEQHCTLQPRPDLGCTREDFGGRVARASLGGDSRNDHGSTPSARSRPWVPASPDHVIGASSFVTAACCGGELYFLDLFFVLLSNSLFLSSSVLLFIKSALLSSCRYPTQCTSPTFLRASLP